MMRAWQKAAEGRRGALLFLGLALALVLPSAGQTGKAGTSAAVQAASARAAMQAPGEVFCEIDDPHSGERWLLLRDPRHPGGPGRLEMSGRREHVQVEAAGANAVSPVNTPIIRAGDLLIVEEHTAVVDARLEAVALGTTAKGAAFKARLKIGGKVVRAVALGHGRAELIPENEAQR